MIIRRRESEAEATDACKLMKTGERRWLENGGGVFMSGKPREQSAAPRRLPSGGAAEVPDAFMF